MLLTLPTPGTPRPPLRIAVSMAAPWAIADELCLEGIEVDEARRYAQWRGRALRWVNVPAASLPQALRDGKVDLAIGGLCASPELAASARLLQFSDKRLGPGGRECPDGTRHVWAVGRSAWLEWASVAAWLQVVRHGKAEADVPVRGAA